jgi:hypothetical protein
MSSNNVHFRGPYTAPEHPELGPVYLGDDGGAYVLADEQDATLGELGGWGWLKKIGSWFSHHGGDVLVIAGTALSARQQQGQYVDPAALQQHTLTPEEQAAVAAAAGKQPQGFKLDTTTLLLIAVVGILVLKR